MAVSAVLGDTVRTSINHFAPDGTPVEGEAFEVLVARRPDGTDFDVSFDSIGDGSYTASVETKHDDPAGEWFLLLRASNGRLYEETFDITGAQSVFRTI